MDVPRHSHAPPLHRSLHPIGPMVVPMLLLAMGFGTALAAGTSPAPAAGVGNRAVPPPGAPGIPEASPLATSMPDFGNGFQVTVLHAASFTPHSCSIPLAYAGDALLDGYMEPYNPEPGDLPNYQVQIQLPNGAEVSDPCPKRLHSLWDPTAQEPCLSRHSGHRPPGWKPAITPTGRRPRNLCKGPPTHPLRHRRLWDELPTPRAGAFQIALPERGPAKHWERSGWAHSNPDGPNTFVTSIDLPAWPTVGICDIVGWAYRDLECRPYAPGPRPPDNDRCSRFWKRAHLANAEPRERSLVGVSVGAANRPPWGL